MDAVKIYNYNNNIEIHILYTAVKYQTGKKQFWADFKIN